MGSRVASFLVLENESDYKRFNLEEERGKTLTGDLGSFLDQAWATLGKIASPGMPSSVCSAVSMPASSC